MKKILVSFIIATLCPILSAQENDWIETQTGSHIFIKKNDVVVDKENPDIKTAKIAVNIPAMQDRQANPTKTLLTNPYPISYVTELIIDCQNKTAKMGGQKLHENFFGEGKLLEQAEPDPLLEFSPLDGTDAIKIWEATCSTTK